jgi:preprotein translocase subunit SecB
MQISPLRLEDYLLKRLRFGLVSPLNDKLDPGVIYDPLDVDINAETHNRDDNPRLWRSELVVRSKEEKEGIYPYTFEIVYVGFFRVIEEFPADRVEQMVRSNGPALLYSAAREALMYLTGRGRLPAVLLPSITFIEPPRNLSQTVKRRASGRAKKISKKK